MSKVTPNILGEVFRERERQDGLWGVQEHDPFYWLSILTEEFGEVGKALCEMKLDEYRTELIQVAAVAVSMVECFDRNKSETRMTALNQLKPIRWDGEFSSDAHDRLKGGGDE